MSSMIEKRIERLRQEMDRAGLDGIVILSDENRRYLSGYTGEDGSYDETAGHLVITGSRLILITDSRYDTQAATEAPLYEVHCLKNSMPKELVQILDSAGVRKAGIESARLTLLQHEKLLQETADCGLPVAFSSADEMLKSFRIIKDDHEIMAIRTALALAEKAFLDFRKTLRVRMTEKQAAWNLEKLLRDSGADSLSFPVIAAAGENSALPHAIPGHREFRKSEPLLFDFGARLNGYCSDTTRTLVMGEPDDTFTQMYDILFNAQEKAIAAIKPGVPASDVDAVARDLIDSTRFKGRFGHGLGHGVGIAIHEAPRLSKTDQTLLEAGMVVTVEPGIYLPDWGGIRLENMVLVTPEGAEVLNTMSYDEFRV